MKLNLSCSVLMTNSARSDEVTTVGTVQMNDGPGGLIRRINDEAYSCGIDYFLSIHRGMCL